MVFQNFLKGTTLHSRLATVGIVVSLYLLTGCAVEAPEAKFARLVSEADKVEKRALRQLNEEPITPQRQMSVMNSYSKINTWYHQEFVNLIHHSPSSETALDSSLWLFTHGNPQYALEVLDDLQKYHLKSKRLLGVAFGLSMVPDPRSEKFLLAVIKENPFPSVKGAASFALGLTYQRANHREEALRLFKEIEKSYGTEETPMGVSLGELVHGSIFEMEHLSPGMAAPEIEGQNVNGETIRMGDLKGKIVLLDFFGDW